MACPSVLLLAIVAVSLCIGLTSAHKGGRVSVDLIHRDSPNSPFFNPQETHIHRLNNALKRSAARANRFNHPASAALHPETAQSEVISDQGEYLMSLSVGTPPFKILAIADTGSDLIWTQCKPCTGCYSQKAPLFDPSSSSTYRDISCGTSQCQELGRTTSCSSKNLCQYSYFYGDQSFTNGNLAFDTITLGSTDSRPVSFPKTVFGCGHNNGGTFREDGSGLIGLGAGSLSLITQMGSSIDGKFSYCLVPFTSQSGNSSKLNFGADAGVSGSGAVSTPLISKKPDTFYYLTLQAISVGTKRVEFTGSSSSGTAEGNIIIDSGTTLTLLPEAFFTELASAVDDAVAGKKTDDPSGLLKLCYEAGPDLKLPVLTAHFSGADVTLNPVNTFLQITEAATCFAFIPSSIGTIYGVIAQANFLVGYDLVGKTVSFKPTDCTSQ